MAELRTGWEPETPDDDIILRQALYNFTDFNVGAAGVMGARMRTSEWLAMADLGRPGAFLNNATFLRPPTSDHVPFMLDEIEAFFGAEGSGPVDVWSAWPTDDFSARGWELGGHPPLMLRLAGGEAPPGPDELEIRQVRNAEHVKEFEQYWRRRSAIRTHRASSTSACSGSTGVTMWLGYVDDVAVATAAVCTTRGVNGVQTIATLPELRGRRLGAAMTWVATLAEPELPAVLLASDLGRGVYERMGFLALSRFSYWRLPR